MSFFRTLTALLLVASLAACTAHDAKPAHRWIALADLQDSLSGQPPLAVGFDIDDTVLFSSPCFYHGQQKYSPGSNDYLRNMEFWREANGGCDRYSLPKQSARALISMHQQRGDAIYFITARPATAGEQLSAIIATTFAIQAMQPVIFTGSADKTAALRQRQIAIYYGDADSDITSAQRAGARAIRILRATNSTNQPLPANGAFGEEMLRGSAD